MAAPAAGRDPGGPGWQERCAGSAGGQGVMGTAGHEQDSDTNSTALCSAPVKLHPGTVSNFGLPNKTDIDKLEQWHQDGPGLERLCSGKSPGAPHSALGCPHLEHSLCAGLGT